MERRFLIGALLVALLTLISSAVPLAAAPGDQAAGAPCIRVADGQGMREFTLTDTLKFLHGCYTDPSAVDDPLRYAQDLYLRGKLLSYFLRHSAELSSSGFFKAEDQAARQAVAASLNSRLVGPEMASALTPKDILALHAIVYATSGPAVFDQFMSEKLAGAALEGKDYAYLAQLKHYVLGASEQIHQVRALSGMYPAAAEAEIRPACSGKTCPSESGDHKCSGACQSEGGKCSGSCESGKAPQGEHKCSGACASGGKCTGACATQGGCSGKCQRHEPGAGAAASPTKVLSDLSIR